MVLLLLQQQSIEVSSFQMFLLGIGIGFVLGLIPLIIGIFKKNMKLGLIGFIFTLLGGAIWSVLALIIMIASTIYIFIKSPKVITAADQADTI
jgi:hypothetical protein